MYVCMYVCVYVCMYICMHVQQFTYLGSTVTDDLSLDTEINQRIGKAATTLARLTTRVWTNPKLTRITKMAVYSPCVISTLLYAMDHICKTGEKTQHFPHEKPPLYPGHILARQSDQRRDPVPRWPPYFVHPAQTAHTSLAGPRPPHGLQ